METRVFSSSGFSHQLRPEELYVLTRHWLSDIAFFGQEINYIEYLVVRFILPNVGTEKLDVLYDLLSQLGELKQGKERLKNNITLHQNELSSILDRNLGTKDLTLNRAQVRLEEEVFDFIKSFRQLKTKLFNATYTVAHREELNDAN